MTTTPDTIAAQEQQAIRAVNAMRLGIARRRALARTEAIDAYARAAELAVSMGEAGRVCTRSLTIFSTAEIADMTAELTKGLDLAAVRKATPASA